MVIIRSYIVLKHSIKVLSQYRPALGCRAPTDGLGAYASNRLPATGYGLANEALGNAIDGSQTLRYLLGIDPGVESVPDAASLIKFRPLLDALGLTKRLF